MKPDKGAHDPTLPITAMDILTNVLGHTDNPGDLGTYLTEKIRELTGAQCVLLVQHLTISDHTSHRVVSVNPPERLEWAGSPAASRLYDLAHRMETSQFWRGDEPSEAATPLRQGGFELSMVLPLNIGAFRAGTVIVLGLPDEKHISSLENLLTNLSAIVALVLRNSFVFECQEETIRDHTEELQKVNERLQTQLIERQQAEKALEENDKQIRHKLDAILSPEADMGALELSDIIDTEKIQQLMDQFYELTNFAMAIVDLHGRVLVGVGWQDICTKFHRVNSESSRLCTESDLELTRNVPVGTFKLYRCKNNMWDMATPIMLGDRQMGNIYIGQFLFDDEKPDYETFRQQAKRYGFDELEYIAALDRVPRWSRKTIDTAMSFFTVFAGMIGNLSYSNIKLANVLEERRIAEEELRESEERFHNMFESHKAVMLIIEPQTGVIVDANQAAVEYYGYSRETLRLMLIQNINQLPPDEVALERQKAAEEQRSYFIFPHRRAGGDVCWVEVYSTPFESRGKTLLFSIIHDITERKRAEDALRASQIRLSRGMEIAHVGHWMYDVDSDTFTFNDNFYRMFRTSVEKVGGYKLSSADYAQRFCHPDDVAVVGKEIQMFIESTRGDYSRQLEHRIIYGDGEVGHVEVRFYIVKDLDGRTVRAYGVNQDITQRKRAEEERLAHLRFFESMDRVNRAMQGTSDLEQMMSDALDVVLSVFNCDRAFLLYPCDPEASSWQVPMERDKPEYPGVLAQGTEMTMDARVAATLRIVLDSDGPVKFGPGTAHFIPEDVTERFGIRSFMSMALYPKVGKPWQFGIHQCSYPRTWTSEEERLLREIGRRLSDSLTSLLVYRDLRKGEEFLSSIVENIPDMIFVKDAEELRFVRFNKAGERLLGYSREDLIGKNDYDFFPKEEADYFTAKDREALSGRTLVDIAEETIRTRSNNERILHTKKIPILDETGKPQYLLGISEDITEHNKLEEQLRQAQKMDAIGQLAGGVAHDFNNMLGVIIGHAELALLKTDLSQPLLANLQEILKAATHSADLTRQLLAFARKQTVALRVLDLNETIEGMLKMLRRLIGEDVDLAWLPGARAWPVKMDPSQIDQILANLCVNARDAIAGVGKITIETRNSSFDEVYCASHVECVPGEYVLLAVSDNGCGMGKETLDKLFEPFFTTKERGKGTGLGLSTVYGIVKQNNGFIYVYSEPEQGTTFKIYLPRYSSQIDQISEEGPPKTLVGGQEMILLAEDDPALLSLTKTLLENLGYRVLAASTPGEIIRLASDATEKIHLLITDVIMPKMNGLDLANNLIPLCPGIKCLFMSGYTSNAIAHHGVLHEGINFIQKPFSVQALAAKIREVLDGQ